MKRAIFVSALVLALMVALCGEAFSRSVPWGYVDPGSGGDDHTWGGDFQAVGDDPGGVYEGGNGGWISTEMMISTLLFKWLGFDDIKYSSDVKADYYIRNQTQETEPVEPVTSNTGGLQ